LKKTSNGKKFEVRVAINGKFHELGRLRDEEKAARLRDQFIVTTQLPNRRLNFPTEYLEYLSKSSKKVFVKDYKGVTRCRQSNDFKATAFLFDKIVLIGNYATELEAAKAYDQFVIDRGVVDMNPLNFRNNKDMLRPSVPVVQVEHIPNGKHTTTQDSLSTTPFHQKERDDIDTEDKDDEVDGDDNVDDDDDDDDSLLEQKKKASKFLGLRSWKDGKTFRVNMKVDGKNQKVGTFETKEHAARARDQFIVTAQLPNRQLNFPDEYLDYLEKSFEPVFVTDYKGVTRNHESNDFQATAFVHHRIVLIGNYPTELEAAKAYDEFVIAQEVIDMNSLNFPYSKVDSKRKYQSNVDFSEDMLRATKEPRHGATDDEEEEVFDDSPI